MAARFVIIATALSLCNAAPFVIRGKITSIYRMVQNKIDSIQNGTKMSGLYRISLKAWQLVRGLNRPNYK